MSPTPQSISCAAVAPTASSSRASLCPCPCLRLCVGRTATTCRAQSLEIVDTAAAAQQQSVALRPDVSDVQLYCTLALALLQRVHRPECRSPEGLDCLPSNPFSRRPGRLLAAASPPRVPLTSSPPKPWPAHPPAPPGPPDLDHVFVVAGTQRSLRSAAGPQQ